MSFIYGIDIDQLESALHDTARNTKDPTKAYVKTIDIIVDRHQHIGKLIHLVMFDNLHDTRSLY